MSDLFVHQNINSIRNKFNQLVYGIKGNIDVFMLSEMKLDHSFLSVHFCVKGYHPLLDSAFVIYVGLQQLPAYIEKKHYQVGKKHYHISFVWHPDSLVQLSDISDGTSSNITTK